MTIWARIAAGSVAETTDIDPAERFSPDLIWIIAPVGTLVGDAYAGGVFTHPGTPTPTLTDLRASRASYRYGREVAGVMFQAAGATASGQLATGRDDQAKLNAAFSMATSGHWVDGTPWKMSDGTFMGLTSADVQAAAVKAAQYIALCYAHEAVLSAALASNSATDITVGWPSNS